MDTWGKPHKRMNPAFSLTGAKVRSIWMDLSLHTGLVALGLPNAKVRLGAHRNGATIMDIDRAVLCVGIAAVLAVAAFNHAYANATQPETIQMESPNVLNVAARTEPAPQHADWTETTPLRGMGGGRMRMAEPILHVAPDLPSEQTYALRGEFTALLALDLQVALRAGFRRFTVTSSGGEVLVARVMATLMNSVDAVVVAEGQCHSACAYFWLATSRRELGEDAHIALQAAFDTTGRAATSAPAGTE